MTTSPRARSAAAAGSALALLALVLTGCGPTSADEATSPAARQSAQSLQAQLQRLSATGVNVAVPDLDTLVVLYGEDGGITCINAESPFQIAFNIGHFGSASGRRAVIVDPSLMAYDKAVITTYCPESLAQYQSVVDGWSSAKTLPGS